MLRYARYTHLRSRVVRFASLFLKMHGLALIPPSWCILERCLRWSHQKFQIRKDYAGPGHLKILTIMKICVEVSIHLTCAIES